MTQDAPAIALTIAGSDSGGGAGIQADLKAFAAHGVYGCSVVTLVTAQNTVGLQGITALEPDFVVAQLRSILSDFPVRAVKTGALGHAGIIGAVADTLAPTGLPLVVDPVMVAKSGDELLAEDAVSALREKLLPLATLVTPNLPEAEVLLNLPSGTQYTPETLAEQVARSLPFPVLLKGGHLTGHDVQDCLVTSEARLTLRAQRQQTRHTHGTGCTLSAAITARLARGESLIQAVEGAHTYVQATIAQAPGLGSGAGPLQHFPVQKNGGITW